MTIYNIFYHFFDFLLNIFPLIFIFVQVVPPKEWVSRKSGYDLNKLRVTIPAPITQVVSGKQGLYQQINIQNQSMSVKAFSELANSEK
jgi:[histone H3]-trimethyl-L-lysine9/36 demethylase